MRRSLGALGAFVPLALAFVAAAIWWAGSPPLALLAVAAGVLLGISVMAAGGWLYMRLRLDPLADAAERLADGEDVVVSPSDVGDRRLGLAYERVAETLREARRAATVDRLTGVPNRPSILATYATEVDRAIRYDRPLAIAFVDVDRFKSINDTFGHQVGDQALHALAQAMREALRSTDVVGRYGGEEFLIVLPETSIDDAATISEKLRSAVEHIDLRSPDESEVHLTISVGITGGRGRMLRPDDLLRGADAAMYAAKALGRNQVSVHQALDELASVSTAPISADDAARARAIGTKARRAAEAELLAFVERLPEGGGRPSPQVLSIADGLARASGLGPADVERVRLAALLRDVGKVAVPDEILGRAGPLTGAEWQLVAQHPRIGQVILEQSAALRDVAPFVLHHHERWSGRGYPYGLRERETPLGARIIAIADAYDGMVASRAHRPSVSHADAVEEIRRRSGSQFDPELVTMFEELFSEAVPIPAPFWIPRADESDRPDASGGSAPAAPEPPADTTRQARRRASPPRRPAGSP